MRYRARRHGSVNQGYFPIKETSDIHPDLVLGWVFCRRAFDLGEDPAYRVPDFWPLPELEPVVRRLSLAHETLIKPVMQSILSHLGCDPHLYDGRLTRTNFGQRLNYYPPLTPEDERSGAGRLLGHEDVDLFTFLPAPRVEGLQVLDRSSMKWVRLVAPPGLDHPEHGRLHAAHHQRPPALDDAPGEPAPGPGAQAADQDLPAHGRIRVGGRAPGGAAGARRSEVRAGQGTCTSIRGSRASTTARTMRSPSSRGGVRS